MGCFHSKPLPKNHRHKRPRKPIVIVDDKEWSEARPEKRKRRHHNERTESPELDKYMRSVQAPLPRHFEKNEMMAKLEEVVGGRVQRVGKRRV